MKYEKITTFTLFCLVLTSVVGLGVGMIFIWLSLIEGWNFLYYIAGFIMVICGMFTTPILGAMMDTNHTRKKWSDYGESSLTLLAVYCGIDKKEPTIPYDSSDFRRCVHLIECLNLNLEQEKSLLNNTMNQYPIWKPLVKNWGKLMNLYLLERYLESSPKLCKLLLKLRILNSTQADKKSVS